jgi:hypothetical protein
LPRLLVLLLLITFVNSLFSCENEQIEKSLPVVTTVSVNLTGDSVYFTGHIPIQVNDVTEYGFQITHDSLLFPMQGNPLDIRIISGLITKGQFRARVFNNFSGDKIFYCRAYLKSGEKISTGKTLLFDAMDSHPPVIDDFMPKVGLPGDEVKIYGSYFNSDPELITVTFGNLQAKILSTSFDRIIVKVPATSWSGEVSITIKEGDVVVTSDTSFSFGGPRIESISKLQGEGSVELEITGSGFAQQAWRNKVKIGPYDVAVTLSSADKLTVQFNTINMSPGKYPLTIEVAGRVCEGPQLFSVITPWQQLATKSGFGLTYSAIFHIGQKIYFCGGASHILNGSFESNELWEYDITQDTWTRKKDYPGIAKLDLTAFALDDKGYVGMGVANGTYATDLWEYIPSTDSWTQKNSIPTASADASAIIFEGKAYVFLETIESANFWSYTATTDTWTQLPSCEFELFDPVAFVFDGKIWTTGYVEEVGNWRKYLWTYDPHNTQFTSTEESHNIIHGFQYGNECYIIYTFTDGFGIGQIRVAEYDPYLGVISAELAMFPVIRRTDPNAVLNGDNLFVGMGWDLSPELDDPRTSANDLWRLPLKR